MKSFRRRRILWLGVTAMMTLWLLGANPAAPPPAGTAGPPNRAPMAWANASSFRLARLDEIPMSRSDDANASLAGPTGWPRWLPDYALDGSPSTKWAADPAPTAWFQLAIANPLAPRPPLAALSIFWGKTLPRRYRVLISQDGRSFSEAASRDGGAERETIDFDPPLPAAALRLEFFELDGAEASIVDLELRGPANEPAPKPVTGLVASAAGPGRVRLKWDGPAGDPVYVYRLYRDIGRPPEPVPNRMIETVAATGFEDLGLQPGLEYHYAVVAETFGGKTSAEPARAAAKTPAAETFARFKYRGVIEGFYNDPWPHQERLRMISFMEDAGFNYYIHAPKIDPYHRQRWRDPYPPEDLKNFAELVAFARAHDVAFNYGLSPGLDLDLANQADLAALDRKLKQLFEVGVRDFTLCLDDIPDDKRADRAMAEKQVALVNRVRAFLTGLDPACRLFFTPTVYSRTPSYYRKQDPKKADYLAALAGLHPEVGIMWTGPGEVFSPRIDLAGALELKQLWARPVLIWDNYPVNDMSQRFNIFTGPYVGRDPDLGQAVDGLFLNPMYLPAASKIALFTAGEYMTKKDYDPGASYRRAIRFVAGDEKAAAPLGLIADCLTPHPVLPDSSLEATPIFQAIEAFWSTRADPAKNQAPKQKLRALFTACASNPTDLRQNLKDPGLLRDLLPASEKLALHGQAGALALDLLETQDATARAALRQRIAALQHQARQIPWRVLDESTSLPPAFLPHKVGTRDAINDFIARVLAASP